MDQRFCYKQNVNFTFGFSDVLNVQFKTDRNHKARGFNCTVTCEGFDFSALFARIPFSNDEAEAEEDEDYEDDYDEDEEYEDDDDYDDYALEDEEEVESNWYYIVSRSSVFRVSIYVRIIVENNNLCDTQYLHS